MADSRMKNYVLPFLVGGPHDKERIHDEELAGDKIRHRVIERGDDVYLRMVEYCWGLQNLIYYVYREWDYRSSHHSYAMQLMFDTHPDVREASKEEVWGSQKL